MRTSLFVFFLFILGCGLSLFASETVRPNGWYYVVDMENDSLSVDPIVTVRDFSMLKLDSVTDAAQDSVTYRIVGKVKDSHEAIWAEATEKSIGKQIGFLFNGILLTAPYVNCSIENGSFFIVTDKVRDMKLLYNALRQEAGCKEEYGTSDRFGNEKESSATFWLVKGGLIGVFLIILCVGLLKLRSIKKGPSRNKRQ